jgi:hypothetical protein
MGKAPRLNMHCGPSAHGSLDPAEVEALLLAEQLAESLRNPAYLQFTPEEPVPAETEEED